MDDSIETHKTRRNREWEVRRSDPRFPSEFTHGGEARD